MKLVFDDKDYKIGETIFTYTCMGILCFLFWKFSWLLASEFKQPGIGCLFAMIWGWNIREIREFPNKLKAIYDKEKL